MAKAVKTNVMRILESAHIDHEVTEYDVKDGKIDGESVAAKVGKDVNKVFKTLVTVGKSKENYVFVVPVNKELDLKKAAHVSGEKSIEMIHQKDLLKITGYIHGGCSPIGMKKQFKTFIHNSAEDMDKITVSAGKVGYQVTLSPQELVAFIDGSFADIIKE